MRLPIHHIAALIALACAAYVGYSLFDRPVPLTVYPFALAALSAAAVSAVIFVRNARFQRAYRATVEHGRIEAPYRSITPYISDQQLAVWHAATPAQRRNAIDASFASTGTYHAARRDHPVVVRHAINDYINHFAFADAHGNRP